MTLDLIKYLKGGDLRSNAKAKELATLIETQYDFNALFHFLHSKDRLLIMRAADVLEKISRGHPNYLWPHQRDILHFLKTAKHKEFKWHLAQMVGRLPLTPIQRLEVSDVLTSWVTDSSESKIVRVNALQALYDINKQYHEREGEIQELIRNLKKEKIPSLISRIRKLTSS
ncbi:hypothetical protein SB49_08195 [Sediminicola sp. YIK13]|uniref:hypothetical protein n=1 Tax=Sediminicola sp. YIK13 TaxID=1453352 RepID=UPI000722947A|nr:hypothetical protein [Sediminicola sp. YIK13]ALM07778.1 hypothetical protein SB49_08195 [Sediminicola sp. YIK13]